MAGTRLFIISSFILPLLLYVIIVCIGYGLLFGHHPIYNDRFHWKRRLYNTIWRRGICPLLSSSLPIHGNQITNSEVLPSLNSSRTVVHPPSVVFITDHKQLLFWKEQIQNLSVLQSSQTTTTGSTGRIGIDENVNVSIHVMSDTVFNHSSFTFQSICDNPTYDTSINLTSLLQNQSNHPIQNGYTTIFMICESRINQRQSQSMVISDSVSMFYPSTQQQQMLDDFQQLFHWIMYPTNLEHYHPSNTNYNAQSRPLEYNLIKNDAYPNKNVVHITIIFDQEIKNWKHYLYTIQNWIDDTIKKIQMNQNSDTTTSIPINKNIILLYKLCDIQTFDVMDIQRSNIIRNIATTIIHDTKRYIHVQAIADILDYSTLFDENKNVVIYIPAKETYFTHDYVDPNSSIPMENITFREESPIIEIGDRSFFFIINQNHTNKKSIDTVIQSTLDTFFNCYILNCLNIPESYNIRKMESLLVSDTKNIKTITNNIMITNHATDQSSHDMILSFYIQMYYHSTVYVWYNMLQKQSTLIYNELLRLQSPKQNMQYDYQCMMISQYTLEYQTMIDLLVSPNTLSILYNNCYLESWEYLQQIDLLAVYLLNNIQQLQQQCDDGHNVDLQIVIHDFPFEQYLAIFGPLLFPLIVPLLMTLIREILRYRKLTQTKKSKSDSQ